MSDGHQQMITYRSKHNISHKMGVQNNMKCSETRLVFAAVMSSMATALKATVHTVNQISIFIAGFFSLSHARIHFDTER
jgi:hypothetical protein